MCVFEGKLLSAWTVISKKTIANTHTCIHIFFTTVALFSIIQRTRLARSSSISRIMRACAVNDPAFFPSKTGRRNSKIDQRAGSNITREQEVPDLLHTTSHSVPPCPSWHGNEYFRKESLRNMENTKQHCVKYSVNKQLNLFAPYDTLEQKINFVIICLMLSNCALRDCSFF